MHLRGASSAAAALRLAGWLRPFVGAFLVVSGLAVATTVAVDRAWGSPPAPPPAVPPAGQRWVEIRVIQADATSASLRCLTKPGVVTEDIVMVTAVDMGGVVHGLCADA